MKLGFFGGCFNPPTIAHYNLAKQALDVYNFDGIYFVPVNDFYSKKSLISIQKRIEMLKLMISNDTKLHVSDIELKNNKLFCASEIFELISSKYKDDDIFFCMGEDNFRKMKSWKDYDKLIQYNYIVFQRSENKPEILDNEKVIYMNNKDIMISSSIVREKLVNCEDVNNLIFDNVKQYITDNKLYI